MDAALLARRVLGWELARFIAHETEAAPAGFLPSYESLLARRERREPVSSITGRREFWGLEFEVTRDVLAPRPETELILEEAIACITRSSRNPRDSAGLLAASGRQSSFLFPDVEDFAHEGLFPPAPGGAGAAVEPVPIIIDAGTGSGCLAVCLAREFPWSRVIATDLSAPALEVAARNAHRHGVAGRIEFVRTSLLDGVACPATLIVSNPPYVPAGDLPALPPEVREWEPTEALDGGADGLDLVRALLESAPLVLAPGGWLIMEFGYGQEDDVRALLRRSPLHLVGIRKDLQQIPRTLVARS
jgi:release factor glutamine methyltransferase